MSDVPRRYIQLFENYDKAFVYYLYNTVKQYTQTDDAAKAVLCVFATPQRAFAQVAKQIARKKGLPELTDEEAQRMVVPLPIMSIHRPVITFDPKRYVKYSMRRAAYDPITKTYLSATFPLPYNIDYQVSIWTRGIDEMDSVCNQLRLDLRANEFWLTVPHPMPVDTRRCLCLLMSESDESNVNTKDTTQRTLHKTFQYRVHGWLCYEPMEASLVHRILIDFYGGPPMDPDQAEFLERVIVPEDETTTESDEIMSTPMPMFCALIVGEAQVGSSYGNLIVPSEMWLDGLQVSVEGRVPTGSDLILQLVVNGGAPDPVRRIVLPQGHRKATVAFGAPVHLLPGQRVSVYCQQIGSSDPGDWIQVQCNMRVRITY